MIPIMLSIALDLYNMSYYFHTFQHKISMFVVSQNVCLCVLECKDH